jgi:hypothetical protein
VAVISTQAAPLALGLGPGLLAAGAAGVFVIAASWWGSADLRTALAR